MLLYQRLFSVSGMMSPTHHLQLILPKLLLLCFVEEGKVPDMVHEYVAQQWQLRVFWSDFSGV